MIAVEAAVSWLEQFPASLFSARYKYTYLWSFCAPLSPNENEICLLSLHWYIVHMHACVCDSVWDSAQGSVSEISPSLCLWSQMGNDLVASRGVLVPLLIPLQDKWAHTYTHIHVQRLRRSFPSKINGPSNAANAIAAKFGAPAGTMRRDFHVVSANNWICPQFGSDEARFLFPPPPAHTQILSLTAFSSLVLLFIVIAKPHFSLFLPSFSFPFLFSTLSSVSIFLRHLENAALPFPFAIWDLHTQRHTHICLRQGKSIVT